MSAGTALAQQLPNQASNIQSLLSVTPSFVTFHGTGGVHGFQLFVPEQALTSFKLGSNSLWQVDAGVRSAEVYSHYSDGSGAYGSVSSFTDTTTHLQVTYQGFASLQPFITVDTNLPSGMATLRGNEKNAIMDRDIVFLTRFGEGTNVNPAVGFTLPFWRYFVASAAVGYNLQGEYVPDGDTEAVYAPGNQLIGTASLQYQNGPLYVSATGIFTNESNEKLNGANYFRPGDMYSALGRASYQWNPRNLTSGSVFYNHTERNVSVDLFSGVFATDPRNSNSDLLIARISHQYNFTPAVGVFGSLEYLNRDANLYEPDSDFFVPAKTKYTVAGGVNYVYSKSISGTASLGYFTLKQESTPFASSLRDNGLIGYLNVAYTF